MKALHLLPISVSLLAATLFAQAPSSGPGVGAKAIPFTEKSTTGQEIKVPEGYKGKLIMLDFWATWCGPCRAELPNLVKVYDEFRSKGFEVIGISLDNEKTMPTLAKFLQDNHMSWQQIADGQGWKAALGAKYDVHAIPAAWLIDGTTGQVVAAKNELRGAALRDTVERCLKNLGKEVPLAATPPATGKPAPAPVPRPPDPALGRAEELAKAGMLAKADEFIAGMSSPVKEKIDLLPPATQPLKGREIAERARNAHVRVGWFFHCTRCNNWHLNAAGGYAIAKDTVATAFHVLEAPSNMKKGDGHPVVIRGETEVIPITGVLAADKEMDAVAVRVAVPNLMPLPLATDPQLGDAAYCFSDPNNTRGYFSNGIVNRLFSLNPSAKGDPRFERINVSTDWSPGSSGSAVLDECGNIIGHVARIESISKGATPRTPPASGQPAAAPADNPTFMNMHEAVPAKSVLTLLGGQKG